MLKNKKRLKPLLLDIFAMNSFSYVVAFMIEIVIAQMSWDAHIKIRLIALVVNSVVARPYTLWRDYINERFNVAPEDSFAKRYLADSFVFLSFQLPIYVGSTILGGASSIEIIKAAITVTVLAGLLGKPYGMYLDWLTQKAGLQFNNNKAAHEAN